MIGLGDHDASPSESFSDFVVSARMEQNFVHL
jgi:hypothetical protein